MRNGAGRGIGDIRVFEAAHGQVCSRCRLPVLADRLRQRRSDIRHRGVGPRARNGRPGDYGIACGEVVVTGAVSGHTCSKSENAPTCGAKM